MKRLEIYFYCFILFAWMVEPSSRADDISNDAANIFKGNCLACHSDEEVAPSDLFDKSNLPKPRRAKEIVKRVNAAITDDDHMPPAKMLSHDAIKTIERWADS